MLDRLVGWETSPVLWRVFGRGQAASAGRVQSVAVRMVVERERARMRFRSGQWYDLEGRRSLARGPAVPRRRSSSSTASGSPRAATSIPRPARSPRARGERRRAARRGRGRRARRPAARRRVHRHVGRVRSVHRAAARRRSPRRRCSRSRAASCASPRRARCRSRSASTSVASSPTCEPTARTCRSRRSRAARTAIREQYGEEYLPAEPRTYRSKVKNAQEAHEAIRPAGDRIRTPDEVRAELDADEQRLYELIWIRTIACQMSDARGSKMTIRIGAHVDRRASARRSARAGKTYDFLGWRRVYVEDVDEGDEVETEARLPAVTEGERVACNELVPVVARDEAARALHRGEPREGARGARHRPAVHVRGGDRDDPGAQLRVAQGHRARSRVDRVRGHEPARDGTSAISSTTASPRRWKRRSTSSRAARVKPRSGCTPSTSGTAHPGCTSLVSRRAARATSTRAASARSRSGPTTPATRSSCASAATARTCSARTTRPRRCRPTSRPTSSRSSSRST